MWKLQPPIILALMGLHFSQPVLEVTHTKGARYLDLWNQREIKPKIIANNHRIAIKS